MNDSMKQNLKILRHTFYLYYTTFGRAHKDTIHAYNNWKDTVIGILEGKW